MVKLRDLDRLFEEHVASSVEKQNFLLSVIGDHSWELDMPTGTLTFRRGDEIKESAVQLLGTQSFITGTWLWAWGNDESAIPADMLGAADHLREVGARDRVASLMTAELAIDEDESDRIAMIACGMLRAQGYYRGPYGKGAAFLLLQEAEWAVEQVPVPAARVAALFPEVLARFELRDQARALRGHLRYHGAEIVQDLRDRIVARFEGGDVVRATFDGLGRMTALEAELATR